MSQEITVTKVEDHHEMQFGGGNAYPVPTRAIDKLADEITPETVGESITFNGDYGGAKHMKSFTVEEVIDGLNDGETDDTDDTEDESGLDESDKVDEELTNEETLAEVEEGDIVEQQEGRESGARYRVEEVVHHPWDDSEITDLKVCPLPGDPGRRKIVLWKAPLFEIVPADGSDEDRGDVLMTDGGQDMADGSSSHPKDWVDCMECGAGSGTWTKKRRLPQIEQTFECSNCGHEVFVFDASDLNEKPLKRFRPVTDGMALNLRFFGEIGDWPDAELGDLYKQGLERVEAIDYRIVEIGGMAQTDWAAETDRKQPTISKSVRKAREKLEE